MYLAFLAPRRLAVGALPGTVFAPPPRPQPACSPRASPPLSACTVCPRLRDCGHRPPRFRRRCLRGLGLELPRHFGPARGPDPLPGLLRHLRFRYVFFQRPLRLLSRSVERSCALSA
eukprot:120961-Pyramimonas_sp.AAC.1